MISRCVARDVPTLTSIVATLRQLRKGLPLIQELTSPEGEFAAQQAGEGECSHT